MPQRSIAPAILAALLLCACGKSPAAKLEQARDLALSGHHNAALIEARAALFQLGEERGDAADAVRRGTLKLAGVFWLPPSMSPRPTTCQTRRAPPAV